MVFICAHKKEQKNPLKCSYGFICAHKQHNKELTLKENKEGKHLVRTLTSYNTMLYNTLHITKSHTNMMFSSIVTKLVGQPRRRLCNGFKQEDYPLFVDSS